MSVVGVASDLQHERFHARPNPMDQPFNTYPSCSIMIMSPTRLQGTSTTYPVFTTFSLIYFHPRSVAHPTVSLSPCLLEPCIFTTIPENPPLESNSRPLHTNTSPHQLGYRRSLRSCRRHICSHCVLSPVRSSQFSLYPFCFPTAYTA